jgi:hypothetical protein
MCDVNEGLKDRRFGATEVDEGRSLDVGRQRQASNQAVRLVALHVNLDKTVDLTKETSSVQAASVKRC